MARRSVIVTGSKELTRRLNFLASEKARALHQQATRESVRPILAEARTNTPTYSGALRSSLTIKALRQNRKGRLGFRVTQKEGFYKGKTFYGGFQEFGWRAGKRRGKSIDNTKWETRRKIPGKWTMRHAGLAKQDEAIAIYERELDSLLLQEAGK